MERNLRHLKKAIIALTVVPLACIVSIPILAFYARPVPPMVVLTLGREVSSGQIQDIDWTWGAVMELARKRRPGADPGELAYIVETTDRKAAKYGLRRTFVAKTVDCESGFNPRARSWCGAKGLMQIMPYHYGWLGITDPFDVEQNLDGGCRYLASLVELFHGREDLALAAYNAGPGRVAAVGRVPDIPETKAYVRRIQIGERSLLRGRRPNPPTTHIYTVQSGDTLGQIARRNGTTVERLARENHIPDVDRIKTGQKLEVR